MSNTSSITSETSAPASLAGEPWWARPSDVLNDFALDVEQKRAILASWLSDRYAIPDAPRWRQLESGAFVESYEVRDALYKLDRADSALANTEECARSAPVKRERRRPLRRGRLIRPFVRRKRRDDDDDPPPSPVGLLAPRPSPLDHGASAIPEFAFAASGWWGCVLDQGERLRRASTRDHIRARRKTGLLICA